MSPSAKFNAFLASTTVFVMFLVVLYGVPHLERLSTEYPFAASLSGLVLSVGVYRLMSLGLRWLMERSTWVSRKVLGPHFVHGTWIGWFEGHTKEKRYMVEHFVQDLDSLVITGRSYDSAFREHGYWESEAASVDARKGKLIFTYKFDVLTRQSSLFGIHTSLWSRRSAHSAPEALSGFAHDLNDATRIAVHSQKLSDKLIEWGPALEEAARRFSRATKT
jgi:hypothetical protein